MATEPMHPIDLAEIELRKAARAFTFHERNASSTSIEHDTAAYALKIAARAYAAAWTSHVLPPKKAPTR